MVVGGVRNARAQTACGTPHSGSLTSAVLGLDVGSTRLIYPNPTLTLHTFAVMIGLKGTLNVRPTSYRC
jgi:hypothetical protein